MTIQGAMRLVRTHVYRTVLGMDIGSKTRLGRIYARNPRRIKIGRDCVLEDGVSLINHGARKAQSIIEIGRNCFIGNDTILNSYFAIYIGEYSMIAPRCQLIDFDHGFTDRAIVIGKQEAIGGAIRIERDVWIGAATIVLKNVFIGEGAVVGAGSVVTKNIAKREIWAGNPAKKIGQRP